jgi:putative ABC transport system permease protein
VIDSLLAAKAFPHQSAVGKRLLVRILKPEPEWLQVIGVVEHERDNSLAREGREELFVTDGYMGHGFVERWAIRSISDPLPLASVVRSHVAQLDSHLIVSDLQPMQAFVQQAQAQTRFVLLLISIFAAVAALLAAIGLYGILHVAVQQRTAEIGVRMALGAQPNRIFLLLIGEGLKLSATGIIVGLLAACGLTRMMVSMLIGVKPTDPKTLVTMVALFFLIATVASWLPARRAAAVDPTVALRKE